MARSTQGFDKLLEDVTKLEVNTIIKDNMTARKMPDPANAILDIGQTYGWYLVERGIPVRRWITEGSPARDEDPNLTLAGLKEAGELEGWLTQPGEDAGRSFSSGEIRIGPECFSGLRWAATTLSQQSGLTRAERVVLQRICRNCDHLKNLLGRLDSDRAFLQVKGKSRGELNALKSTGYWERALINLAPDDTNLLRKIWEIGVEDVVAQATIQLDGDVVNRLSSVCLSQDKARVLEIHRLGIESAVGYWSGLMGALASFVGDLVGIVTGVRR